MPKTIYLANQVLSGVYLGSTFTAPTTIYVALLTAVADDELGSFTEAAYTGYLRQSAAFSSLQSANGGQQVQNTSNITFPQAGSGPTTVIAFGLLDSGAAGPSSHLLNVVYIDGKSPIVADYDTSTANTFAAPAHGYSANQQVRVEAIPGASSLPSALSPNTTYFVISPTTNQFQLSTTSGGGTLSLVSAGSALVIPLTPVTINQNDTPQIAAGTLKLVED